jgi:predicted permease
VFGLAPALSIGRAEAQGALRDDARGASEGRRPRRLRGVLVAAQLALCASLLAGAGLLTRSLWRMATAPLGFDSNGILTARFRLSTTDYPTQEGRARFHQQLLERLRALPGVEAAAIAHKLPAVDMRTTSFALEAAPADGPQPMVVDASVSDDYFRMLRIPLRQGRLFEPTDRAGSPPVVLISEAMARHYFPPDQVLGTRLRLGGERVTVVGVVGDVRNDLARPEAGPVVYRSHRQESSQRFCVLLRTRGDPLGLVRPLQREVAALDPALPIQQPMTLDAAVGEGLASRRLPVMLLGAFGALALLLASVGVYAMFSGMAAAREREFGVRMALGSRPAEIASLLLRQGAGWVAVGLLGAAVGIAVVVRVVRGWLYGVAALDPIGLGAAIATLMICAAIALLGPVRRAMRVDPIAALRAE